ncbi:outer membrane lipoprotein-sorting protein [Edaphobacter sp.]|uniref:LolA family protein n=1 Tax=Edaphobacter sp. TaxID=1934404 RepID=UPI002DB7A736|nr:outer membrane lipoprotein-sorting protein [Edaphobacter sp.]HEU5341287.1 outer membrane lipoprotein-sorting protein [Edaphobacter sp.]
MTPTRLAAVLAAALALTIPAHAQTLPEVLHQMDAASTRFHTAEADFRWDLYERVVRQTTTQNGSIYFEKTGAATQMGAKINPPYAKFLEYKNGTLRLFDPGADHLTILHAGANQQQYESFLTLGFGGSGTALAKSWNITLQGKETLNDGSGPVDTVKLDLVPKDPKVLENVTHITIWVDLKRGVSLKQQFFLPSEDQKTATYTHIRYNQKVNTGPYAIKTNKKTTIDNR